MMCDVGLPMIQRSPVWKFKEFIESLAIETDRSPFDTILRNEALLGHDFYVIAWRVLNVEGFQDVDANGEIIDPDGPNRIEYAITMLNRHKPFFELPPGMAFSLTGEVVPAAVAADQFLQLIQEYP
jgi:hypothetical protein